MWRNICWPTLACSIGVAFPARAQLVVGNDIDANIWLVDVEGISVPRPIVRGSNALSGAIAADPRGTLYWINGQQTLVKALYNQVGALTPVVVANLTVGGAAAGNFVGLAFDTVENKLYAYRNNGTLGTEGFYEINTTTGACTLRWAASNTALDFGGFDYDSANDVFYAVNDSVTALPTGRGLYRIRKPLASPAIEFVVASPNNDSDIDGLAVGGGRVYLVNDNATQGAYVYDLASQQFLASIPLPYTINGTFAGATWAPEIVAANLSVELLVPPACGLAPEGAFEYSILVRNLGPDAAKDARLDTTLPANTTFVSSVPESNADMGVVHFELGHMQANTSQVVRVRLRAPASGSLEFQAAARTRTVDPVMTNNTATAMRTVGVGGVPAMVSARVLVSSVQSSASSIVADAALGGARYITGTDISLGRPYASPGGNYVAFVARTSAGTDLSNDALFRMNAAGTASLVAREGVTRVTDTVAIRGVGTATPFQPSISVNDLGHVAFAAIDSGGLGFAVLWNEIAFSLLGQQDHAVAALGGDITFSRGQFGCQVDSMDRPYLLSRLAGTGINGSNDTLVLRGLLDILVRSGQTVPFEQDGATEAAVRAIPLATSDAQEVFAVDRTGGHVLYRGTIALADATKDEVLVVDNHVVVQEGVVLPGSGFKSPVRGSVATARFAGDGSWLAMGSNASDSMVGSHWVVREGAVIARRGDTITPCVMEHWVQGTSDGPFLAVAGNARGDVVVAGYTDAEDAAQRAVLVLNSSRVIARAGDPLDLDSNGLFDDGAFIEQFKPDHLEVGDSAVYVGVTVASPSTSDCGAARTRVGEAILRIPLGCVADVDDGSSTGTPDGGVTIEDLIYYLDIFTQGLPGADLDDGTSTGRVDCGVTVDDLLFFLLRYEQGC